MFLFPFYPNRLHNSLLPRRLLVRVHLLPMSAYGMNLLVLLHMDNLLLQDLLLYYFSKIYRQPYFPNGITHRLHLLPNMFLLYQLQLCRLNLLQPDMIYSVYQQHYRIDTLFHQPYMQWNWLRQISLLQRALYLLDCWYMLHCLAMLYLTDHMYYLRTQKAFRC